MKSKVICVLNKESISLIEKYFNLSDYDIICFDQVSGQKVADLDYNIIDISVNFPCKLGFVSGSSLTQIISYYKNKNVFDWRIPSETLLDFAEADIITSHPTQVKGRALA